MEIHSAVAAARYDGALAAAFAAAGVGGELAARRRRKKKGAQVSREMLNELFARAAADRHDRDIESFTGMTDDDYNALAATLAEQQRVSRDGDGARDSLFAGYDGERFGFDDAANEPDSTAPVTDSTPPPKSERETQPLAVIHPAPVHLNSRGHAHTAAGAPKNHASAKPRSLLSRAWLPLCLAVACFFGFRYFSGGESQSIAEKNESRWTTKPIEDIRPVVDWVLSDNPELPDGVQNDFGEVDPPNWRVVHFRMAKDDGGRLDIWLARPLWHLEEMGALQAGNTVWMDLEEMGAVGNAEVMSIAQCPQPPPQPTPRHRLVTGRYVHHAADIVELHIEGVAEPIGTTANHPFWSEDRNAFVSARDLGRGELVRGLDDVTFRVLSHSDRPTAKVVYNLEVDGEHVYFVSSQGVLVHNHCSRTAEQLKGCRPYAESWRSCPPFCSRWQVQRSQLDDSDTRA